MASSIPGRSLEAKSCVFLLEGTLSNHLFAGSADFLGCTFDASAVSSIQGGVLEAALISRGGPLALTFKNNVVLMPAASVLANVFSNLKSTDSLVFERNGCCLQGSVLSYRYDDGASVMNRGLNAWQALGFDAGSFDSGDLVLSTAYVPQPASPLLNAGADLGPGTDFQGRSVTVRNDIGACEAPVTYAYWQAASFTAGELAQPSLTDPLASYRNDGVKNLMKYALGLAPGSDNSDWWPEIIGVQPGAGATPQVTVRYPRIRDAADIRYVIETSPDLKSWTDGEVVSEAIVGGDPITEMVEAQVSLGTAERGFLRLRAAQTLP
jgi:hypothetical protein